MTYIKLISGKLDEISLLAKNSKKVPEKRPIYCIFVSITPIQSTWQNREIICGVLSRLQNHFFLNLISKEEQFLFHKINFVARMIPIIIKKKVEKREKRKILQDYFTKNTIFGR